LFKEWRPAAPTRIIIAWINSHQIQLSLSGLQNSHLSATTTTSTTAAQHYIRRRSTRTARWQLCRFGRLPPTASSESHVTCAWLQGRRALRLELNRCCILGEKFLEPPAARQQQQQQLLQEAN
jgi:hypothetical protein